jgi:hypothetical protein
MAFTSSTLLRMSLALPLVAAFAVRTASPPRKAVTTVRLTMGTLHAAALTSPRAAADSTDAPYVLVAILGPKTRTETLHLPATGHLRIHLDEAIGAHPLLDLQLAPGDTVRLLVSVLEEDKVLRGDEAAAVDASIKALDARARMVALTSALAPVTRNGAHWLGSATLMLTNEGGTTYWRALDCVATCKVLSGFAPAALPAPTAAPARGVVELSGAGATYHMQLQGRLAQ